MSAGRGLTNFESETAASGCMASVWRQTLVGAVTFVGWLALSWPPAVQAQFSYVHRELEPERVDSNEAAGDGPAGPLLSLRFSEPRETLELLPRQEDQWKHASPRWIDEDELISPTLFDGAKAAPQNSRIPQVGRIHSAREWRAWRRRRRRWSDSWLFFPISLTKFTGLLRSHEPVHDQISDGEGSLTGLRGGWDIAPRIGVESRLAFARQLLKEQFHLGPQAHENFILWDADLLIYPWGDRPWRPYLMVGLGLADVRYIDNASVFWHQTLLTTPIGAGLQYRFNNRAAVRVDVIDNMLLRNRAGGGSRHLQHDLAITFGFEVRFARPHKPYFDYPHSRLHGLKVFMPYHSD